MSDASAVVKFTDMSDDMQQEAIDCAIKAMHKYPIENDVASAIKREFDTKFTPTWHCFVGRNFGCFVTHQTETFIYFYIGQIAVMLFKMG